MAVAYASHTVTEDFGDGAVAATKPTGLASGDMMVAFCFREDAAGATPDDFTAPAGWTKLGTTASGDERITGFAKVADSSDAAASTFSFTPDGTVGEKSVVVLVRVTGTSFSGGVATLVVDAQSTDDSVGGENLAQFGGLTPVGANSLLLMAGADESDVDTIGSGYAITTSNPSWTEIVDGLYDPSGTGLNYCVAYANRPEATATGNFSYTPTANGTYAGFLVSVNESTDVTVSPAVVTAAANIIAPSVTGGATVSPAVVTAQASVQAPSVTTAAAKWTNPDKNAAPSWTNPDKT